MKNLFLLVLLGFMVLVSCNTEKTTELEVVSDFSGELTEKEIKDAKLTPEILWKFGRLGNAELSPDGEFIVYSVSRYDAKTLKKTSNVYVIPAKGGEPNLLTEDRFMDVSPTWMPDGRIAFLSNRYGDYQVWVMNYDGSARMPFSEIEGGVNAFRISPDGSKMFYLKDVKLETTVLEKHADLPEANARVMDDLMYRHWNDWTDYKFSHIFVAEVIDSKVKEGVDIMEGEKWDAPLSPYFDESEISWSPSGKTIAYTCKKLYGRKYAVSTNSDIYLYDIETKETKNITKDNKGYDKYPVFSPDGNKIAWMSMETPGYEADKERLMVLDLASGKKHYLNESWDQNAYDYVWNSDGKVIYFMSGIKATSQIYKVTIASKEFTQITKGQHDYQGFSMASGNIIGSKTTHQMAAEIFVINEASGKDTQVTFINKNIYDSINLGHTEERWIKTTDGKDMLVWVIYPPNFDANKKYPALLYCQGGPQSAVSQFFSYRWNFAIMAANDYIIVAPNRRGLPSFGREWNAQISTDYAGQNIKDYLSAIDALKTEPFIDENKLGCVGASYGGYSTFYLAGHHEKRFKAFISHCGMYNLESFAVATEETFFVNHDMGGMPWEVDNEVAQKSYANSPHKFVQNWDTPILIITGGKDFRIPYTESLQAFNAAQLQGIPSKLLYFPEETHFVSQPQNAILWQREFFDWLDKYLK
ncbi:MAG: S9 family peptidase [Salinivirgaceae bacterium]|jgi:dipeptidyl aminopeptidase/acylaminoacyl peptidase|nr:S9 family peptidase [Salinivirgaceae bacterium]